MSKVKLLSIGLLFILSAAIVMAQEMPRTELYVPHVDPGVITLDAQMNESAWQNAAEANLVTNTGYNMWINYYGREGLTDPEYDEYYARLLWTKDTLYVFIHMDEIVNDSSGLWWGGQWVGDQLFVALSDQFGRDMDDDSVNYDGNVYAAPDGPYHFLIMGYDVTLNNGALTYVPEEWRKCPTDTNLVFNASDYERSAISIDTVNGVWNLEMAIYNPGVFDQSSIGFNIGGSQGSWQHDINEGDAYAYYCWQPNIPDDPFTTPVNLPTGVSDPGGAVLINSERWAVLNFEGDSTRVVLEVPKVDPSAITLDAQMNEPEWENAAEVNLVTSTGYNMWINYYDREGLTDPEYDEYWARLLATKDTLYVFIHMDEIVNDSSGLWWGGQWVGDQLFVGLSNRFGVDLDDDSVNYDGNVYTAPGGPYHYLIMGNDVTLNNGAATYVPEEWRGCPQDTFVVFNASNYERHAISIDTVTGVWNLELAIYNPNIFEQSRIGFNIGGSQGSWQHDIGAGDAYAYYCWQPNIPDDPFTAPPNLPAGVSDPGGAVLVNSERWAVLTFPDPTLNVREDHSNTVTPTAFNLSQNYPNPFNPTTTINFAVPQRSNVTLRVYNILGQLVTTLINNQNFSTGSYSVDFDASKLASGMYIYQLDAGNTQIAKKMLLIK
jgi:hypothetical protein